MILPDPVWRVTAGSLAHFLLALLVMPFGVLAGVVVASALAGALGSPIEAGQDVALTLKIWFFVLLAAPIYLMPLTALLGLPAHLLLLVLGLRQWLAYGTLGAVVGAIFATVLAPLFGLPMPSSDPATLAFEGGAGGLGGALAFWAVLRPDQELTEPDTNNA